MSGSRQSSISEDNVMEVEQDFRDLFELFNAHDVAYTIVEAHAPAFHGAPRYTGDIEGFVRADGENAKRIVRALGEFGFGPPGLTVEDFAIQGKIVQLGVAPVRVAIVTAITGAPPGGSCCWKRGRDLWRRCSPLYWERAVHSEQMGDREKQGPS